jgi:hypothetical protein
MKKKSKDKAAAFAAIMGGMKPAGKPVGKGGKKGKMPSFMTKKGGDK